MSAISCTNELKIFHVCLTYHVYVLLAFLIILDSNETLLSANLHLLKLLTYQDLIFYLSHKIIKSIPEYLFISIPKYIPIVQYLRETQRIISNLSNVREFDVWKIPFLHIQKLYEKLMSLYMQLDKSSRVHITWEKLHVFTTTVGRNCSQLFQARRGKKFVEWKYVERDISPRGISNRARNKGGTPCVHLLSFLRFYSFATPSFARPSSLPLWATNHLAHILFSRRILPSGRAKKKKEPENPKKKPLLVYPRA